MKLFNLMKGVIKMKKKENTGDYNTGDGNTGDYNTGDYYLNIRFCETGTEPKEITEKEFLKLVKDYENRR